MTWPEQWRKITHSMTRALSNPFRNVSININNVRIQCALTAGLIPELTCSNQRFYQMRKISSESLWSEVCEKQKMPLWVSVCSSAFRYQKQACYGEGQAVCQTVVSKKDQWGGLLLKSLLSLSSYKLSFHSLLYNRQWKHWQVGWLENGSTRMNADRWHLSCLLHFFPKMFWKSFTEKHFSHSLKTWDMRKRCDSNCEHDAFGWRINCSIFILELI